MKRLLILPFLLPDAHAYILALKNYRLAKPHDTSVKISSEGCPSVSDGELEEGIERSLELWNSVPESRLRLSSGGRSATSIASASIPGGEVIVGCSVLSGTSGLTSYDEANGSAKVVLNSNDFVPGGYTADGLAGIITHELGHAIGLHHSKDPASVMTYEANGWGAMPSYLAQDDVDGVTYLYPNEKELGGLLGSCDSFASSDIQMSKGGLFLEQFLTSLFFSIGIVGLLKLLRRKSRF